MPTSTAASLAHAFGMTQIIECRASRRVTARKKVALANVRTSRVDLALSIVNVGYLRREAGFRRVFGPNVRGGLLDA
jgi:hypothetical protein